MSLYFFWQECFTPAGHGAASLLFFLMFAGMVPGFWAAWILCGLDFLFFLSLFISLFFTGRKTWNKVCVKKLSVNSVFQGETAVVQACIESSVPLYETTLGCFRMPKSLKMVEEQCTREKCFIKTSCRGAFSLERVVVLIPEIRGMLRFPMPCKTSLELLVYPRPIRLKEFRFLTGSVVLQQSFVRGMNFAGLREYQEGDSLRDLHHKAFARYGKPFTKLYEQDRDAGVVLVLDVQMSSRTKRACGEQCIRLAAGVGMWLMERGVLGRFFIGNREIPLGSEKKSRQDYSDFLAELSRITFAPTKKIEKWAPQAMPMGPVLRLGVEKIKDSRIHKQIIVSGTHLFSLWLDKENQDVAWVEIPQSAGEVAL
ncbi:MAG: DUF58 domain-containing protein [Fibrobacteraceae bacterium]|nr:DUF58 domain-containing protein [Fibrobacteraceae bacterium]